MMDDKILELMNRELDGLNTPSASRELQDVLEKNAEARKLFDDLQRTSKALEGLQPAEPPPYLKTHIMNAVRAVAEKPRESWVSKMAGQLWSRPARRYAVVFASGLCVGILFFVVTNVMERRAGLESASSGSFITAADLSHLPLIDALDLSERDMMANIKCYRNETGIAVALSVDAQKEVSIELISESDELAFKGMSRIEGSEGGVNVIQGKVTFADVRSCRSVVLFSRVSRLQRPLEVRVYDSNGILRSASLRVD